MLRTAPFQFPTPSSVLIVGPSGSGKTVFTTRLLTDNVDLFATRPSTIHYCYGSWQTSFETLKKKGVTFSAGVPTERDLYKWFPRGGLLVMDDLMTEGNNDKSVLDIFTKHSHHRNITVLYLCQDMFPPGQICQEYFAQRPLHRGLQESQGSIGYAQRGLASVSRQVAKGVGGLSQRDVETVWLSGVGSTSGQQRRSEARESSVKRGGIHTRVSAGRIDATGCRPVRNDVLPSFRVSATTC